MHEIKAATSEERTIEMDVAEALEHLAAACVSVAREQDILRGMVVKVLDERAQIVEERNKVVPLVQELDTKLKIITALVDTHHEVLTKLAGLPPRSKGDPLVN